MAYPAGTTRGAFISLAAGACAALAFLMERRELLAEGFVAHQALLGLVSLYLWSGAYLLVHRSLVFVPALWRPLFAPLWQNVWYVFMMPFLLGILLVGPAFSDYLTFWGDASRRFTYWTAGVHFFLLMCERFAPPSYPIKPASSALPPELDWGAGLLLALPAIFVGWLSVILLQDAFWGAGNALVVMLVLYSLPALAGTVLYLAVYLLLWRVRPLYRPLWAPLWGLGLFALTPFCALLFYAAYVGLTAIVMTYAFTCLTAWCHCLLMMGWAYRGRFRAA